MVSPTERDLADGLECEDELRAGGDPGQRRGAEERGVEYSGELELEQRGPGQEDRDHKEGTGRADH